MKEHLNKIDAMVDGELTDEEIDRILDEAKVPELGDVPLEYDRQVARAIERALNQRLAVKEGEACNHRIADARNQYVKSGYVCVDCCAIFSAVDHGTGTHPAPDDQQAKDAAITALLACKEVCSATGAMKEVGMAIDAIAALSATKQEET